MYTGTLSNLGASTTFSSIPVVSGAKYKIWFTRPASLVDSLWTIVYKNMNVGQRYAANWNKQYSSNPKRFTITRGADMVDNGKYLYIEGIGGSTNETFGKLALDAYWARGNSLWDKSSHGGIGGIFWFPRGVEGVSYHLIADETGKPLHEVVGELPSNSTPVILPALPATPFPWGTVAGITGAAAALSIGIYVWTKRRKHKLSKKV